jgi:hypothetical protein
MTAKASTKFALPMNVVAADVRRLIHIFGAGSQSLLMSAATVQGFNAQTLAPGILTLTLSHLLGEGTAINIFNIAGSASRQHRCLMVRKAAKDSPSPLGGERAGVRGLL